jgi:hypothetical protein
MKTSEQVLAELLANLQAAVSTAQEALTERTADRILSEALTPHSAGRVLGHTRVNPFIVSVAEILERELDKSYGYYRDQLDGAVNRLMVGMELPYTDLFPATIQANNAWLTLALGPDAPQFVAEPGGWALVLLEQ